MGQSKQDSPGSSKPRNSRQRPGTACSECRRRKLRCDGLRPKCTVCSQSGVECEVVTEKATRGPKKGYIQALRNRIAVLESQLASQDPDGTPFDESSSEKAASSSAAISPGPLQSPRIHDPSSQYSYDVFGSNAIQSLNLGMHFPDDDQSSVSQIFGPNMRLSESPESFVLDAGALSPLANITCSHAHQAELNQLYFDRVQPSVPILHQKRYLSWSKRVDKTNSQRALQYAVWMLASIVSPQGHNAHEKLYDAAKKCVESSSKPFDAELASMQDLELVQAIILVSVYESMRGFYDTAWMSTGRARRMVQLMRLHEIDDGVQSQLMDQNDPIETEELRRAFWMAYLMDNIFSVRGNWPVALTEKMIHTRLPMPEYEFQNEQPIQTDFLAEVILEPIPQPRSPFCESIIFATICSHSHFQSVAAGLSAMGDDARSNWDYIQSPVTKGPPPRMHFIWHFDSPSANTPDAMRILANALAQLSVILFFRQLTQPNMDSPVSSMDWLAQGQTRALIAADRIVDATMQLTMLHYSRLHPLLPIILRMNADFLYNNSTAEPAHQSLVKFAQSLSSLRVFSDASQNYAGLLGISHLVDIV
ncbi:hypothetical protein PWT90_05780 [Aphanocladium album]|nr:hypothetical protein PWT90_05780 [Aphanocladium album]